MTLPQLQAEGINPTIIESPCDPAGGPLNRLAAYQAMQHLGQKGGLFFEDDVDIDSTTFQDAIDLVIHQNEVCTFFVPKRASLHPTDVLTNLAASIPIPLQVAPLMNTQERRGFYGTQAMYLPEWFVMTALADREAFMQPTGLPLEQSHGFDFYIKERAPRILGVFPNPVQHRNPPKMKMVTSGRSAVPADGHTSLTYGWAVA